MYRLSDYTSIFREKNFYILHNTLYGGLMKVYSDSAKAYIDKIENDKVFVVEDTQNEFYSALEKNRFIVNTDINEQNIVNLRYSQYCKNTLSVIILPTRQCNFRCPYCYEEHESKFMEHNVYDAIIKMIIKEVKIKGYKRINISWFGGEPTLQQDEICSFMRKLHLDLNGNLIRGQMTTNGYLLTPLLFQQLVKVGITNYQITIDGLRSTHNKTRVLASGEGTWDKIIDNLREMKKSDLNFRITIRTNFTKEIVHAAEEWFDFLSRELLDDRRFLLYFEPVKNLGKNNEYVLKEKSGNESDKLFEIARKKRINTAFSSWLNNFAMMCYAGKENSIVIDYDGSIKKCTVALDSPHNKVGQLSENNKLKINEGKFAWWTSYVHDIDCLKCKIYPLCYSKKCPSCYKSTSYCKTIIELYESIVKSNLGIE